MSHAVIIKKAVKKYGNFTALNGVDLEIKPGEFFTLLGPSGLRSEGKEMPEGSDPWQGRRGTGACADQ